MTTKLKSRIAIVTLVIGGLAFLEASMLLGYYPSQFILPSTLTLLSALLGSRWIRIAGICLCAASIAMGIHHYQRKQHVDAVLRAVREKAETNSISN